MQREAGREPRCLGPIEGHGSFVVEVAQPVAVPLDRVQNVLEVGAAPARGDLRAYGIGAVDVTLSQSPMVLSGRIGFSFRAVDSRTMPLEFTETPVIGSNDNAFMTVRHLSMRGTNFEIGKKLAEIAMQRHGTLVKNQADPLTVKAQRSYLRARYPMHHERMRGAAEAYHVAFDEDNASLSALPYNLGRPSCSVVYYPPTCTESGHGILSRNYDFFTGTLSEMFGAPRPQPGEKPLMSEPYLVEVHPDDGYPSLYTTCFDLFGCIDGINSEGLAVAMLGDDETLMSYPSERMMGLAVGLSEVQVLRFLLDTCGNAEEAREALLNSKQYYSFAPQHYIIGDSSGDSFIWELSPMRNQEHITDGKGKPQAVTNHLVYDGYEPWQGIVFQDSRDRLKILKERLSARPSSSKFTLDSIRETNACVFFGGDKSASRKDSRTRPMGRTLWHGIYDVEDRSLTISFYLRDEPEQRGAGSQVVRSAYREFRLH